MPIYQLALVCRDGEASANQLVTAWNRRPALQRNSTSPASARDFIEPAHRCRVEARLGGAVGGEDHFDFYFHSILTPLDPAFAFFTSFVHDMRYSGK